MNHHDIPPFMALIRPRTGTVTSVRPTSRGNNSATTAVIDCARGPFFVKAVPNRPGGRRDSLRREARINPHIRPLCPAVRWQAEDDAWIVLGFDVIDARPTDFVPGSSDLPAVVGILNRIAALPLPDIARDWPETRWDSHAASDTDATLFQGTTLLYTDITPDNLMVGEGRTWALDWAWPTRGAAFIDPALLVVQLIAAGHTAEGAETWAAGCTAWPNADPRAIDAFATATARMWNTYANRRPETAWLKVMADAARAWADHRGLALAR